MNCYEIINNYEGQLEDITFLETFIDFCLNKLSLEKCIFNIILVSNDEIKKINKEYRNIDKETDVISFALEDNNDVTYQDNIRLLGDIYISIDKMNQQATLYEHSTKRELSFLTIHGLLHLLGYDHMNEEDEKIMFDLQEELLHGFEITRK